MKNIFKKTNLIALTLCVSALVLSGCASGSGSPAVPDDETAEETVQAVYEEEDSSPVSDDIVILFTNDVHCAVDTNLGYASLAAYKDLMEEETDYVTLVDIGDAVQGAAAGAVSKGEYIIDIMNYIGYDLAVLGNHEFDYGIDQLSYLIDKSDADYLACNLIYLGSGTSVVDRIEPYEILTYGDTKVAYIGVATPESRSKTAPSTFQDDDGNYIYDFCGSDADEFYGLVQGYVDECRDLGADYVILLTHLGVLDTSSPFTSTELIEATTGVDAVLDGHSHTVIPSAVIKNADGEPVVLSSTGTNLEYIGRLTITAGGNISSSLISRVDFSNDEAALVLKDIQQEYEEIFSEIICVSEVPLTILTDDGILMVRNRETNTGDFCADAYRIITGADVAFVNGGGIRSGVDVGDVTFEDLINISPYGNELCVVETTGQQILDALEMSYRYVEAEQNDGELPIGQTGAFLQISGLRCTIDTSVPSSVTTDEYGMFTGVDGEYRVKDVEVLQDDGTWDALDPDKTYTAASHSYIMESGGSGMNMFLEDEFIIEGGITDYQVLISYVEDFLDGVIGSEYETTQDRITVK